MEKQIREKLEEVTAKFNQLTEQATVIRGQVNEGNKQLSAISEEQVRLQGEARALNNLLPEERIYLGWRE